MKDIVLYTKGYCPYCKLADTILRDKGVDFKNIDVTDDQATFDTAIKKSGSKTVPQLFVDGVFIGGYDDMSSLDEKNELDDILGIPCKGYC